MTASTAPVRESDIDAMMRLSQTMVAVVSESAAALESEVSHQQLRALVVLASRSEVNAGALAATLGIHQSNVSRLCDRLVQAGLLDRGELSSDRRHVSLSLSPQGTNLVNRLMNRRRERLRTLLAQLSPKHQAELATAANRLAALGGEPTDVGRPTPAGRHPERNV